MKMKSELASNLLKILLWALAAFAGADLLAMCYYAYDYDGFMEYVYTAYGFIDLYGGILYYICVVVYLVWIFRVHMDLTSRFPMQARTPGKSLVCILVPFYNLYGIPSVYAQIGALFGSLPSTQKKGSLVAGLAAPLLIVMIVSNLLNRMVLRAEEPNATMLLMASLGTFALYAIFLTLCIQVSDGLKRIFASFSAEVDTGAESADTFYDRPSSATEA